MTIDEWLKRRDPHPPAPLMDRVRAAIGARLADDATDTASVLLVVAERTLRELVAAGQSGRDVADDLLTIDALTTYALEAASESIQSLLTFSGDAMTRLADVARSPDDSALPDA